MSSTKHSQLIILGSGPAGYTASIYAARANLYPILITGTEIGGQLNKTNQIENWPGEPQTISGSTLMQRMHTQTNKFGTKIILDKIININLKNQPFLLQGDHNKYTCNALIISTGASVRYLGLPSEKIYQGKGVSYCATCDGFFFKNKKVAVIGGGNTAIEETLYLSNIASEVHLIHRRDIFTAEKILIDRLINAKKKNHIIIHSPFILKEIYGSKTQVTEINIQKITNHELEKIKIDGIFIAIGYDPNTSIFSDQLLLKNGYIRTGIYKNSQTSTSIPGVFAAGDVMDQQYRQAITASASGCMAAIDVERYLSKLKNR